MYSCAVIADPRFAKLLPEVEVGTVWYHGLATLTMDLIS
jgi:hypothetical protein